MLLAALRRFVAILGAIAIGTAAVSIVLGLLLGSSVSRSAAVGFYLVGSFMLIIGFFIGNRGPIRPKGEPFAGFIGSHVVRWATAAEQDEAINSSAVFVGIGFGLILLGVLADTRYQLF